MKSANNIALAKGPSKETVRQLGIKAGAAVLGVFCIVYVGQKVFSGHRNVYAYSESIKSSNLQALSQVSDLSEIEQMTKDKIDLAIEKNRRRVEEFRIFGQSAKSLKLFINSRDLSEEVSKNLNKNREYYVAGVDHSNLILEHFEIKEPISNSLNEMVLPLEHKQSKDKLLIVFTRPSVLSEDWEVTDATIDLGLQGEAFKR